MSLQAEVELAAAGVLVIALSGLLAGCSDSNGMMSPGGSGRVALSVSPADGALEVRLDAPIIITFSRPVDQAEVEGGMHLIGERAISDTSCPDPSSMGHTDMTHCMADTAMMRHMDEWHSTPGSFSWNQAGTVCTFQPGGMMTADTRYMVHMDDRMMEMMGATGGAMGGHGTGMMQDHMMLHFRTVTADGHEGHH